MAKKMTKEDVLRNAKELDVQFIHLEFTDIFGVMKNVAITIEQLEKALNNEIMFDGSSIDGFVRIEESDMYLRPDPSTFVIFPWATQVKEARLICMYTIKTMNPLLAAPEVSLKAFLKKQRKWDI